MATICIVSVLAGFSCGGRISNGQLEVHCAEKKQLMGLHSPHVTTECASRPLSSDYANQ